MEHKVGLILLYLGVVIFLNSSWLAQVPTNQPAIKRENVDLHYDKTHRNQNKIRNFEGTGFLKKNLNSKLFTKDWSGVNLFRDWQKASHVICDGGNHAIKRASASLAGSLSSSPSGSLTGYPGFIHMRNVILDSSRFMQRDPGCTNDHIECWGLKSGFFQVSCELHRGGHFWGNERMQIWYKGITRSLSRSREPETTIPQFTLAVHRRVHFNFYHTVQELYGTFLMMEFFNVSQSKTNILFVEHNIKTPLDLIWDELFNFTAVIASVPPNVRYSNLVLSISNHDNGMNVFDAPVLPLVEEFRNFVLTTYNIPHNTDVLHCDKIKIVFLWRNHVKTYAKASQYKSLTRKIQNMEELIRSLQDHFPTFTIQGLQLESLSFREQLQIISRTDVLIGMLGAGLTHSMFLPKHAGLIELRPHYWRSKDRYYEAIARWRNLKYKMWKNDKREREKPGYRTYIHPVILINLVKNLTSLMCNN